MFTSEYRVFFEKYAERHFIKDFEKKYKTNWLVTRKAIVAQLHNVDMLVKAGRTNPPIHLSADRNEWILKHEFKLAGTKCSKKSSGCRIIAYINETEKVVRVLLVYHKDHLSKDRTETQAWEFLIRSAYPDLLRNLTF